MTSVTIQELKQSMAAVLARVGLGEWVTVLRHGKPVARLGPAVEPGVHVGSRFGKGAGIVAAGRRLSRGAYLAVLAEDRSGERE